MRGGEDLSGKSIIIFDEGGNRKNLKNTLKLLHWFDFLVSK